MDRKARASMARVVHRYQESQRRTWCSSSPASSLPARKFSSVVQRIPATLTKVASGTGGGYSNGKRQLPGAAVAADQRPAVTRAAGVDGRPGPVVIPVALGALAGRVALPGPRGGRAASWPAGQVPAAVATRWLGATASTYPVWRRSRSARSPGSAPYTSSPVIHAAGARQFKFRSRRRASSFQRPRRL
jgi:hypothetical protein